MQIEFVFTIHGPTSTIKVLREAEPGKLEIADQVELTEEETTFLQKTIKDTIEVGVFMQRTFDKFKKYEDSDEFKKLWEPLINWDWKNPEENSKDNE